MIKNNFLLLVLAGTLLVSVTVSSRFLDNSQSEQRLGISGAPADSEIKIPGSLYVQNKSVSIQQPSVSQESKITVVENKNTPKITLAPKPLLGSSREFSEDEIFKIQHPERYLDYLSTIEDLMIKRGALKPNEKQIFTSEYQVQEFFKNEVFDFMVDAKIAAPSERSRFYAGLDTVRKIHVEERKASGLKSAPTSQYNQPDALSMLDFFKKFLTAFSPAPARAQAECSHERVQLDGVEGTNLTAICCDCDIDGEPVGCLNLYCEDYSAIYDYVTFICGCAL